MKRGFVVILLLCVFLISACDIAVPPPVEIVEEVNEPQEQPVVEDEPQEAPQADEEPEVIEQAPEPSDLPEWMNVELKNIADGKTFKVSDFIGKPIFLESFAVWCPLCTEQQRKDEVLHKQEGDRIVFISLDTDPNEDEQFVKDHIQRNGFTTLYAISPVDLTRDLIDVFGIGIVNAPSVPMILICEDGKFKKLKNGQKSNDYLLGEIEKGC